MGWSRRGFCDGLHSATAFFSSMMTRLCSTMIFLSSTSSPGLQPRYFFKDLHMILLERHILDGETLIIQKSFVRQLLVKCRFFSLVPNAHILPDLWNNTNIPSWLRRTKESSFEIEVGQIRFLVLIFDHSDTT